MKIPRGTLPCIVAFAFAACTAITFQPAPITSPDVPAHGYVYADEAEAFDASEQFAECVDVLAVPDGFITWPCALDPSGRLREG